MLTENRFSLVAPDGPPERLGLVCDFRGKGFPGGSGSGAIWLPGTGIGRSYKRPAERPAHKRGVPQRKAKPKNPPSRRPGRPGTPVNKPALSPQETRNGLNAMQWTYLGKQLVGAPEIVEMPGKDLPAGWDLPGIRARWQVSCGGDDPFNRWNAYSVNANGNIATFESFQCHVGPGDGTGWDVLDDWDNHRLYLPDNRDCVFIGPAPAVADWWIQSEVGIMVDRSVTGPGPLVIPWVEGASEPAIQFELPPKPQTAVETTLDSGFVPTYKLVPWLKARSAADPSLRGYDPPGQSESDGGDRPAIVPPIRPLPSRPKPYVREHKYRAEKRIRYRGSKVERLFHWASEVKDFWEILYENLDKSVIDRTNCKGVVCMINAVAANLDKLDVEGALGDLIANEVEDQAVGRAHRAVQGPSGGRTPGFGLGQLR